MPTKLLGERIKRKEDPRLIQGRGHFVDDIKLDGMLHMAFARSPYGHARITSINTEAARNAPGVVAVLTSEDLKGKLGQIPCAVGMEGLKVPDHYCLAVERVRYVGEPVVAVVAADRYLAADAASQVEVEYEMLPAVTNMDKALESGSALIHQAFGDNIAFTAKLEGGDWKKVDADAAVKVIKQRLINQRLGPVAMETRGVVASYSPGEDTLTVWSSTQIPHILKTQLSLMTRIDEPRCTWTTSGCPLLSMMALAKSSQRVTFFPATAVTRSPGLMPLRSAGFPLTTSPILVVDDGTPSMKTTMKTR